MPIIKFIFLATCLSITYILLVAGLFVVRDNYEKIVSSEIYPGTPYFETSLMKATKNIDIIKMNKLIRAGANVNAVYGSDFPNAGEPILVYAIDSKSLEAVITLLKAGANPNDFTSRSSMNYYNDENTSIRNIPLLSYAIITKAPIDIITELLQNGADPNLRGLFFEFWTPLMIAAYHGYTDAVRSLLSAGANIDETNITVKGQKTALDYAREKGHKEIIKILSSRMH